MLDPNNVLGFKNDSISRRHRKAIKRAFGHPGLLPVGTVVDFGCGIGRNYELLRNYAGQYVGLDISEGMLAKLREHLQPGDSCHLIEGYRLPLPEETVDTVFCFWVLQHVVIDDDLTQLITEFRRILRPGRHVIACERSSKASKEPRDTTNYILPRSPETWISIFQEGGFELSTAFKAPYKLRFSHLCKDLLEDGDNLYIFARK